MHYEAVKTSLQPWRNLIKTPTEAALMDIACVLASMTDTLDEIKENQNDSLDYLCGIEAALNELSEAWGKKSQ